VVVALTGHSSRLDVDPTMKINQRVKLQEPDTKHTIGHLESLEITSVMLKKMSHTSRVVNYRDLPGKTESMSAIRDPRIIQNFEAHWAFFAILDGLD